MEEEEKEKSQNNKTVPNCAISFQSVSKRHHKELPLLENVSFTLDYGDVAVIVGPSGSGKTTLLQMASALLSPDSGQITIDGKHVFPEGERHQQKKADSTKAGELLRRSLLSYVPQEDFLLESLTVFENVSIALDLQGTKEEDDGGKDRDRRVKQVLDELGIGALGDRMIYQISAGERRRCAIARALVRNPKILIADEPTASLDIEKTKELMSYLKTKQTSEGEQGRRMAILIASHDVLELAPYADSIYEIQNASLHCKVKK